MSVQEAAERLASSDFLRVVGHADADGVSAAACLCSALTDAGVGYQFTALEDPSDVVTQNADVFCDLGAQYLDELGDPVVVDHHPPRGNFDGVLVGTEEPSSSIAAHRVGSRLSSGDPVAALVGAIGDGVALDEVSSVVDEAVDSGVERDEGVRLVGEDAVEALTYSTRPFTSLSGEYDAAREFVDDVGEDLPTAVVLLALTNEAADVGAVAGLAGELYRLPSSDVHLHELSRYVETCAVSGKHGLAFSACLDTDGHLDAARKAWRAFESTVVEKVRNAEVEEGTPSFVLTDGEFDTGAVADVMHDWVVGDLVVLNEGGEASFRGSFDCERVAREAAQAVGGDGGGHPSRAGASFDVRRDEFVAAVKEAL